eukprot:TRINITY_DN6495_c0_g1_i3.p1 TRINITY_DN6495_c0_g1~~TRINITY_DN6495_c0_g1_i3.p1  ORF type:complete len:827 (-),score=142.11 TRINITY_DN6495_c0_g1_i3:119-2599(-)
MHALLQLSLRSTLSSLIFRKLFPSKVAQRGLCVSSERRYALVDLSPLHKLIEDTIKENPTSDFKGLLQHNLRLMAQSDRSIEIDPLKIYTTTVTLYQNVPHYYSKACVNIPNTPFCSMPEKNLYFKSKKQAETIAALACCTKLEKMGILKSVKHIPTPSLIWNKIFSTAPIIEDYEPEEKPTLPPISLSKAFLIPRWDDPNDLPVHIYELYWQYQTSDQTLDMKVYAVSPHDVVFPPLTISMSKYKSVFSLIRKTSTTLPLSVRQSVTETAMHEQRTFGSKNMSNFSDDHPIYYVGPLIWNQSTSTFQERAQEPIGDGSHLGVFPIQNRVTHQVFDRLGIYFQSLLSHYRGKAEFESVIGKLDINPVVLLQACTHPSLLSRISSNFPNRRDSLGHEDLHRAIPVYQRLEYLGDSVLDLSITLWGCKTFTSNVIKTIADQKVALASNNSLRKIALEFRIDRMVMCSNSQFGSLSSSIIADVMESIIGAVYLDKGLKAAVQFCLENIIGTDKMETAALLDDGQLRDFFFQKSSSSALTSHWSKVARDVRDDLKIEFGDLDILLKSTCNEEYLSAVMPSTMSDVKTLFQERLRVLGLSLLKFHLANDLYQTFPTFRESLLTSVRCRVASNQFLAQVYNQNKLRSVLSDRRGYQKLLSDTNIAELVVCTLAGEFLDRGLYQIYADPKHPLLSQKAVRQHTFLYGHLMPKKFVMQEWVENQETINPKGYLQELSLGRFNSLPTYEILDSAVSSDGRNMYTVALTINGRSYGTASGYSLMEAQERVAKIAIRILQARTTLTQSDAKNLPYALPIVLDKDDSSEKPSLVSSQA